MIFASAESIAEDLAAYGEEETARWVLTCTDDEFARVCSVGGYVLSYGPALPSGRSMLYSKALALAAVYVHEGAPRQLARSRRSRVQWTTADTERKLPYDLDVPYLYGVGDDIREFFGDTSLTTAEGPSPT